MIEFKAVRWSNFLSTGDKFTEIQLNRSPSTLIVGSNGAGKSTLLDALSFALFGKAHRDIKKPQLVNSINGKHCVVEAEFSIGKHDFKIHRGIKPNKFQIYQNGHLINEDSKAKDYQKFLEQNILKLNHKSFHQVVVLGSSSFIPFMQLPTGQRRQVIEDLLDIQVFSKMNIVLKEKDKRLKEKIQDTNYQLDLLKEKIGFQHKYIKDISELNAEHSKEKQNTIETYQQEVKTLQDENIDLSNKSSEISNGLSDKITTTESKKSKLDSYKYQFNSQIKDIVNNAKFFEDNTTCPTCDQEILESLREEKKQGYAEKAKELSQALSKVEEETATVQNAIAKLQAKAEEVRGYNTSIHSNNSAISRYQSDISRLEQEINDLSSSTGDLSTANNELEELIADKESSLELKLSLLEERTYNDAASEMLKDTGIKTKVIKQYLPVMNKLINTYLQTLDFFVSFHLDENFNEIIKSRHRDAFNYTSFSEGEKQRIDLALLFTWRQIAKMKNSASTNLLILDETFDSSLDVDGVDNLTKILSTLEDGTNVFIISHKGEILENKFRNKIEFTKERNFSKIK